MRLFKSSPLRSKKHRMNVASLECVACGLEGSTQAAHRNEGKGMGIKACDSQMMALCVRCHADIDQGGNLDRETRRAIELAFVKVTRQIMKNRNLWSADIESAYQKINPDQFVAGQGSINAANGVPN